MNGRKFGQSGAAGTQGGGAFGSAFGAPATSQPASLFGATTSASGGGLFGSSTQPKPLFGKFQNLNLRTNYLLLSINIPYVSMPKKQCEKSTLINFFSGIRKIC